MGNLCKSHSGNQLYKYRLIIIFVNIIGIFMAAQASSENIQTGLKSVLEKDWGYVLSLEPGPNGDGSKANPFKITSTDPNEISRTAFFTVQGLHRGMSALHKDESDKITGVLWKVVNPLTFDPDTSMLELEVERTILTQTEKISETVSYYFTPTNDYKPINNDYSLPTGFYSDELGLRMPYEIGSLQYKPDQTVNYAEKHNRPDLGYGFEFNAIGIETTAYIYPLPSFISDNTLLEEFEKSAGHVLQMSKEKLVAWPDQNIEGRLYRRYWAVGDEAEKATALWLFSFKNQFVKLRLTWERDPTLDSVAMEFPNLFATELFGN